jgi:hypothetical protein
MLSSILQNTSLPRTQEIRIQEVLENTPRFAPWGAKNWRAPKGFTWTTVEGNPIPEAVLADAETHRAVFVAGHYSYPIFVDDEVIVLVRSNDSTPAIYIVRVEELRSQSDLFVATKHNGHCYFPFLNRSEILQLCPNLPTLIASHYKIEDKVFVWSWKPHSGIYVNEELSWFNSCTSAAKFESIELIRVDTATGLIIGMGTGVPNFVMDSEFKKIIGFARRHKDDTLDEKSETLIQSWTDRIIRHEAKRMASMR